MTVEPLRDFVPIIVVEGSFMSPTAAEEAPELRIPGCAPPSQPYIRMRRVPARQLHSAAAADQYPKKRSPSFEGLPLAQTNEPIPIKCDKYWVGTGVGR